MSDPQFVPGLELAEGFYADHVGPILTRAFPQRRHSAALIGSGSEVLGFDTPMSADHHWGPRVMLFLEPAALETHAEAIRDELAQRLPPSYRGFSTHYTEPNPLDNGVQLLAPHPGGPVNHRVELYSIEGFFLSYLNLQATRELDPVDWLTFPSQKLRAIGAGRVFRDDLGLEQMRAKLEWYPRDVELYLLGCLWIRIGQEDHLMGRAAHAGDELGSTLIAGRLVRDLMRIVFLLQRQHPPYPKWFGTAFSRLTGVQALRSQLELAARAPRLAERQAALGSACETVAAMQHAAGFPLGTGGKLRPFWGRPFLVIGADPIAEAVFARIADPTLAELARTRKLGALDTFSDSTDLLDDPTLRPLLRELYRPR